MAGEANVTLVGNLTDDPELKYTQGGDAVATFGVAVTGRTKRDGQWVDSETSFYRCQAWRTLAENVVGSLTKGTRVFVTGTLRVRQFERQDGTRGTSVEVQVDEVGPSVRFASVQVTRGGERRQPAAQPAQPDPWASAPAPDEPPF